MFPGAQIPGGALACGPGVPRFITHILALGSTSGSPGHWCSLAGLHPVALGVVGAVLVPTSRWRRSLRVREGC